MYDVVFCFCFFFLSVQIISTDDILCMYRISSNYGIPSLLANYILNIVAFNIHLFSKSNELIFNTKFAILRFYFMVPSQKLFLSPGALFRRNMVLSKFQIQNMIQCINYDYYIELFISTIQTHNLV